MTKSDITNPWKGQKCPFCEKGVLEKVSKNTFQCSKCDELLNVDNTWLARRVPDIIIPVWSDGDQREFCAMSKTTTEELLQHLVQAYILIESCAISQPDNDILQTLMHITKHSLERLEIWEHEPGQFPTTHKVGLVNGDSNWVDPSIFEVTEPW